MRLQQIINETNELIEVIDRRINEYEKLNKKLEAKMLLTPKNKENRIEWYIATSTTEKLMDLKLLLLKDINNTINKVKAEADGIFDGVNIFEGIEES